MSMTGITGSIKHGVKRKIPEFAEMYGITRAEALRRLIALGLDTLPVAPLVPLAIQSRHPEG
jgi:hypothetical protein